MAGLVAARSLANRGVGVLLLARPGTIGGSFRPKLIGGREVPVGPRFLELGYEDDPLTSPALDSYVPGMHGHRAFTPRVRTFIEREANIEVEKVSRMAVQRNRMRVPDFLFSVDLCRTRDLFTARENSAIRRETRLAETRLGAAGVRNSANYARRSVAWASLANHGPTFHAAVIEALGNRIAPDGVRRTLAPYARKLWLTVFHPRTINQAFRGLEPDFKPRREIFTPKGGFGRMLGSLEDGIRDYGGLIQEYESVDVSTSADGAHIVRVDSDLTVRCDHIVFAGSPSDAGAPQAGALGRFPAQIVWVEVEFGVPADDFPTLIHILDRDCPLYRISAGSTAPGVFCLEYSGALSLDEALRRAQTDLGTHVPELQGAAVAVLEGITIQQVSYSGANVARMRESLKVLEQRRESNRVHFTGGLTAVGADSLNEQVVQGLRIAELIASEIDS